MSHFPHRLVETASPGAEPLTLDEVKTFLRVDHSNDDTFISDLIAAARQHCETLTGRSLITRSYNLFLDVWPGNGADLWWDGVREGVDVTGGARSIDMPRPPLLSVTQIKVYAADNTSSVFSTSNYYVDTAGFPGRVILTQGAVPPLPGRVANGIEIQFKAGYGATPQSIPGVLRHAMRQVIAHMYEHRGDSIESAAEASGAADIFQSYRVMGIA